MDLLAVPSKEVILTAVKLPGDSNMKHNVRVPSASMTLILNGSSLVPVSLPLTVTIATKLSILTVICEKGLILFYEYSFYSIFIRIWNSLPANIIQSTNLEIIIIFNYLSILTLFCTTILNFESVQ